MISDGLKAVKGSEVCKEVDKMLEPYCYVCVSYHSPVSLFKVCGQRQMAWIKTSSIFGLDN